MFICCILLILKIKSSEIVFVEFQKVILNRILCINNDNVSPVLEDIIIFKIKFVTLKMEEKYASKLIICV